MKTYLPRKRAESQIIENIKELCRLCLNECVNGIPIYPDSECEAQPILATKIMMCVGIEVVPRSNELSNLVCLHCMEAINKNYSFRKVCEIAYQRIKLHLQANQIIKYKHTPHQIGTLPKELNKDSENNYQSLKNVNEKNTQNIDRTQNVIDKDLISYATINQELIKPVEQLLNVDKQQTVTSNEILQPNENTYLDHYTGKLQIVEIQQELGHIENLQSIENEITEPIIETNELNPHSLKIENTSHLNKLINQDGISQENEVSNIENNILVPTMYDISKNVMLENYFQPVPAEVPNQIADDNLNPIYFLKAKEKNDCDVMECTENVNTVSTSNLNNTSINQILTIDISNELRGSSNNTPEIMSQFIVSRLKECGLIEMEGDAISICDVGTIHLETMNGEIVTMEIVEEDLHKEFKTRKRKKQPEAHTCSQCGLVVKSRASLVRHSLRHSAERKFACDQCPRTFRQPGVLKRHRTLHQEVRPFPCPSCDASFTQRGALVSHAKSHASSSHITLHMCRECDATYAHASGLVRHVKRVHLGFKPQCTGCSKTFYDQSSLDRHLESCAGKIPFQCPNCSKILTRFVKRHLRSCRIPCGSCFKLFTDRQSLKEHLENCVEAQVNSQAECQIAPLPSAADSV